MADVVLNLIYNDNGAGKNVDNLVRSLQQIESKHYRVNISTPDVQASVNSLKRMTDEINRIKNLANIPLRFTTEPASISSLDSIIKTVESKIESAKIRAQELAIELEARLNLGGKFEGEPGETGVGKNIESLQTAINNTQERLVLLNEEFDILHEKRVDADITSGLTEKIEEADQATKDLIESQEQLSNSSKDVSNANAEIALGYKQTWRGVQQTVSGVLSTLQNAYNTWRSVVEAPLNLTGVSSLVSMLESMEGSLLLNQISSNITTGFSEGVERYDILMSFPAVMENIGYSTDQATAAMDRLYQSVLGLPTSFGDIVQNTQFFTLVLDDLEKATDLAIAANNAFVASGADSQQISSGMRQLQYILEGTKLRSTQWYSLIRSMPLALREVGDALGYPDFSSFTADLMAGSIASEDLIDTLIDVGLNSEKLGGIIDVMKSRIQAALDNVTNAGKRMGETLTKTLDEVLTREGGKGITENIKGVSDVIDHITAVAAQWISDHGAEIQALIDKFFDIDWASVVPEFLQGLVNIANKALDNIGTWIQDIGGIIEKVGTLFNDIENSQTLKVISGIVGGIGSIAQIFTGISNIRLGSALIKGGSAAGGSLAGAEGTVTALALGAKALPFLGYATIGVLIGDLLLKITDEGFAGVKDSIVGKFSNFINDVVTAASNVSDVRKTIIHNNAVRIALEYQRGQLAVPWSSGAGRVPGGYLTRDKLKDRLSEVASIVSKSGFDESGWVYTMLLRLGENIEQISDKEGVKIYKAANNIAEKIDYYKTAYIDSLDSYLEELDSRIKYYEELNNKLQEQIEKPIEYAGQDKFEKLYGEGGFFSKQYKKAKGWGYSNTVADLQSSYEELYPKAQGVLEGLYEAALQLDGEDRDKVLKGFYGELASIDWTDEDDLKRIVENYGNKTPGEVFSQYFIPRATVSELEDGMGDFSSNLQIAINNALIGGVSDEEDRVRKRRNHFVEKLWDDTVDDTETLYEQSGLIETIDTASEEIVSALENILSDVDPSEAQAAINSYFNSLGDTTETAYRRYLDRINSLPQFKFNYTPPQTEFEGGRLIARATGGFTPMGTDTVPAMLTPGEYVQRRAAVEHFGRQFMERINALDLRGALRSISMNYSTPYATGGFVRSDNRSYRDNHATVNQIFKSANASTGFRRASRFVRALG